MKSFLTIIILLFSLCFGLHSQAQETTAPKKVVTTPAERKPVILASLLRGPYLQVATSNSILIRWRTDALTRSVVHYGTELGRLNMTAEDSTLTLEHKVLLNGLTPRTKYFYSVGGGLGDTLQMGPENYFVTMPVPGTEGLFRIGVFGDCGNNSTNQHKVRDAFINFMGTDKQMDSWILLGDNAYNSGTDPEFQRNFFNVYKDNLLTKYPLFPAPGNHDYNDFYRFKASAQATHDVPYYSIFSMPTKGEAGGVASNSQAFYSFDIGNIHFLSLDSYGKENNETRLYDTLGAQVEWIKKDLDAFKNKQRGWIVAFWHHPPFTMGSHNSDRENELVKIRENFIRILERYGVDLVLCGHSHLYERSRLMNGHYGMETTFDSVQHNVSNSSALYNGSVNSCPYIKNSATNKGTVYVVTGSAGAMGSVQQTYPHNAMYYSYNTLGGASMLQVEGNRLDLTFITSDGQVRDQFVMMKDVNKKTTINARKGERISLTPSYVGAYKWSNGATEKVLNVMPPAGKTVYTVQDANSCLSDTFEVIVSRK